MHISLLVFVSTTTQIFLGRPSPELTLKMLREGGGSSLTAGIGNGVPTMEADVKEQAESNIQSLREAIQKDEIEEINKAHDELKTIQAKLSEQAYREQMNKSSGNQEKSENNDNDNSSDADFKEK